MMFGYGSGWPAWGIALMWIGITAFLAFLIWAAYALITSTSRRPGRAVAADDGSVRITLYFNQRSPAARSTPRNTDGSAT